MKLERSILVNASIVALALGTLVLLFLTRERPSTEEEAARQHNLFPVAFDERLRSLGIASRGQQFSLEVRRATSEQEPSYFLVAKEASPADPEAALGLLRALELASFLRRFDGDAVDRKDLGLSSPEAEVVADFGSFKTRVLIGKSAVSPPGTTYVEVEPGNGQSNSVGLVRSDALKELWIKPDDLKPRGLLPPGSGDFVRISMEGPGYKVSLKKARGPAFFDEGGQRVRRAATERLLLELASMKFERFVAAKAAAESMNNQSSMRLSLQQKAEGPRIEISVGGRCPNSETDLLALRSAPDKVAGCISSTFSALLTEVASNLRDDSPFFLRVDEIEIFSIEREGKKLELARTERGFELRFPTQGDVGLAEGNRRLADLVSVQGEPVGNPDLATLGFTPPRGILKLRSSVMDGIPELEETLDLGREMPDGRLPVRRGIDGAVLLLPRQAARVYTADSTLLRSTRIFDFGPSALEKLSVERNGTRQVLGRTSSGGLELIEPVGFEVDGALALNLVQALGTLDAVRWVADAEDESFGLQSPKATLTLEFAARDAGPKIEILRIGGETSEGLFGKLDSKPSVFLVSKSVADQTLGLLLSRAVFSSDRAKIEQIELERGGRKLRIERRGGSFSSAPGTQLSAVAVETIVNVVSDLRAEAALHIGPPRPQEGFGSGLLLHVRSDSAEPKRKTIRIGAGDSFREVSVFYARMDGIDATYALPQSNVRPLLDAF